MGHGVLVTLRDNSVQFIQGADEIEDNNVFGLVLCRDSRAVARFTSTEWKSAIMLDNLDDLAQNDQGIWVANTPEGESDGISEPIPEP